MIIFFRKATTGQGKKRKRHANFKRVNGKIECPYCQKLMLRSANMSAHIRTHTQEKPYNCKLCTKEFSSKTSLNKHQKFFHLGLRYKCSICEQSYTNVTRLRDHMNKHTGNTPHKCTICEESFKSQESLKRHVDLHLKKYHCEICNKSFLAKKHLDRHLKLHDKGNIQKRKPRCDRDTSGLGSSEIAAKNKKSVVGSLCNKTVQNINKNQKYVCDECNKLFQSSKELMEHLLEHKKSDQIQGQTETNSEKSNEIENSSIQSYNSETESEESNKIETFVGEIIVKIENNTADD